MEQTKVIEELEWYVRKEFLQGDPSAELDAATPLLEWGILNSMNTAQLIAFVSERFDVAIAPQSVNAANFRDLASVAALVIEASPAQNG